MITSAQYSVDGTAVKIVATNQGFRNVSIHPTTSGSIYIGPAGVTTSTGFLIDNATGPYSLLVAPQDEIWATAASGTKTVTVITSGS